MLDSVNPRDGAFSCDPSMWLGPNADRRGMLERLGLTAQWVGADLAFSQQEMDRWLCGNSDHEGLLDTFVGHIESVFREESNGVVGAICSESELPDEVILLTPAEDRDVARVTSLPEGMPARFHQKAMLDAREGLKEIGVKAEILSLDVDRYRQWLGQAEDTKDARFQWAQACGQVITQ